jgi:hypothetical protein
MEKQPTTQPFIQPEINPSPQVEHQVNLTAKSREKTAVTIDLEPGATLSVSVKQQNANGSPLSLERKTFFNLIEPAEFVESPLVPTTSEKAVTPKVSIWQVWLIVAALVVYLATRFIGLDSYPIYFFTDEAVQTVLAADLVRDDFHDYHGEILPTYFVNGGQYNLGPSVYLQVLPWLMFGKSIWVTRGTSVILSLLAALAIGLILKNHIKSRYAFAGILLLSITPAWFLHSRTAFETVIAVSFYAVFLYTYLQYRNGQLKYFYASVVFGALCFYTYSPAQLVMAVTAAGLLLTDIRTHIKNWKTILIGLGMVAILAIPYIRFLILHPDENLRHLEILDSYWVQAIPLTQKLGNYFKEYLKMLNPFYWFMPNQIDLERHIMKGYGHLLRWTIPFFLLGLGICIRKITKPQYRIFLISLMAAPAGAALAGAAVTRSLFMVIPAVVLTTIGLDQTLAWIEKIKIPRASLIGVVFAGLTTFNGFMLRDALVNGPLWYSDYSLGGQQYGAKQLFSEIKEMLKADPNEKIFLSPSWANGTDVLARFFFNDPVPFEMGSIDSYLFEKREIKPDQVFILIPDEMQRAQESGKFKTLDIFTTLNYPNGVPGFYFVRLQYVDNIDEILQKEKEARQQLTNTQVTDKQGRMLTVGYPKLDMGTINNLFDGDGSSLVRTAESNPLVLKITPAVPLKINQIIVRIGGTASTLDVQITPADGSTPIKLNKVVPENTDIHDVLFTLDKSVTVSEITISVMNTHDDDRAHVHAWEVSFN